MDQFLSGMLGELGIGDIVQQQAQAAQEFMGQMGAGLAQQQQQQQQRGVPQQSDKPPPASKRFIKALRPQPVTGDDVQEANNKECLICLDDHEIGSLAVKLPCGHLYHKPCVQEWLEKHCTCPVCRYEVESNDASYEISRKKRMRAERKMRVRYDELKSMKVSELKTICTQLEVKITHCIDKNEIIENIIRSGKVEVLEGVALLEIPLAEWESLGVKDLKSMLKNYGISESGAIMKSELRNALLESGRIAIVPVADSDISIPITTACEPSDEGVNENEHDQKEPASLLKEGGEGYSASECLRADDDVSSSNGENSGSCSSSSTPPLLSPKYENIPAADYTNAGTSPYDDMGWRRLWAHLLLRSLTAM